MNYQVTVSGDPELAQESVDFVSSGFGNMSMNVNTTSSHHHHHSNSGNAEVSFNGGFGMPNMTMEVKETHSGHHHHHSNGGNAEISINSGFGMPSMTMSVTDSNSGHHHHHHKESASVNLSLGGIVGAVVGAVTGGVMIDGRNRIWVQLNQSSYVGGDIISGTIEMDCIVPFFAKGVIVKVKGFERLWLQELRTETEGEGSNKRTVYKTIDHKENKEFFKSTIVVYPQAGTVNCGHYSFPFSYQLPSDLPGTFCHDGKDAMGAYSAKILYKCKATVDVAHKHDLKSTTKLIINEKCGELVQPSFAENKKSFMLTKGKLHVKTWLNKNAYFPGETLVAKMKANNTSIKPTRKISLVVHHTMQLKTRLYHRCITNAIYKQQYDGFQPCFYGKRYLPFSIPVDLKPSSSLGKHITSSYLLELECDIPMAIDLSVTLPLTLFAPQFLYSTVPSQPPGTPLPPDVSYRHPWEGDEHATACRKCNKGFSLFARKHHCRHCMKIFCDKCTSTKTTITKLAYPKPVRVCEECYPIATQGGNKYQSAKLMAAQYQASLNAYYAQYASLYPQIYPDQQQQQQQPSAPPQQY
ncbi:FYVE-type zinc finger-containing protein [Dictyostelium discoideum AX4]|uniref:Arrestin domain-containing protein A n=1 Tax=Dictyostelium discoideum TaxID=44689 RepID=ADCA_DICDI|nr:FYVE-type zinc finger-containing protein [Dictyostelium discoideum AX4]Q54CH1.1 RecName: Full=Arrestin domain-containing protein A [Dictyostelium discoideum]EAL61011.1 FYVE-type zinc finger-containing protein [Dictyostelium discoideum AX4]|eukprot:XP_629445.1 FYVE-type zinc finger-containing protein [Dictyostelium discoideum AX4]